MATRTPLKPAARHTKHGLLTDQHRVFIDAYMAQGCKDQKGAAIKAGVSEKSAASMGSIWLNSEKYPQISAEIERRQEHERNTVGVTRDRVLKELARIFFFNPKMLLKPGGKGTIDLASMPDEVAAVIKNINISYSEDENEDGSFTRVKNFNYTLHDKLSAGALLMRMLGLGETDKPTPNSAGGMTAVALIDFNALWAGQATPSKNVAQEVLERELRALGQSSPPENPVAGSAPNGQPQLILNDEQE